MMALAAPRLSICYRYAVSTTTWVAPQRRSKYKRSGALGVPRLPSTCDFYDCYATLHLVGLLLSVFGPARSKYRGAANLLFTSSSSGFKPGPVTSIVTSALAVALAGTFLLAPASLSSTQQPPAKQQQSGTQQQKEQKKPEAQPQGKK